MNSFELRLIKEYQNFEKNSPEGISINLNQDKINSWEGLIFGPYDSPWEGGIFKLNIDFPVDYPHKAPKIIFITPMFHPNIYKNGSICLDILQSKWNPVLDIKSILISIQSLLTDPNINSPANMEASTLYKTDIKQYKKKVRIYAENSII